MKSGQIKAKIISNRKISARYWHLEFTAALIAQHSVPGQFVNIKVASGSEPLLRRPLSIHSVAGNKVKVLYEILGQGTQILSTRKPGELLELIGPLGNGFDCRAALKSKKTKNIIIAGGIGAAPLVFLAKKIKLTQPLVLIGARNKLGLLCVPEFKALGAEVSIATDDGSAGFRGQVTDLLKIILAQNPQAQIFSCGPALMLKAVGKVAQENKINAQLSLEAHMACGIGACLGCVVATKRGYQTVCKDGPVFSSQELVW